MDLSVIEAALEAARRRGAFETEVVFIRDVELSIEAAKGEVETLVLAESVGAGVRVLTDDRRMGFAYGTALGDGLETVVEAAWQNALPNEPDEFQGLIDEPAISEDDWAEDAFGEIPVERKIELCRDLERQTLAADHRIVQVQEAGYEDSRIEFTIANSHGLCRRYANAYCSCSVVASAAQSGSDSEMGWEFDFARRFDALRPDRVARGCAKRATECLGGAPCASGAMPVVLDNYVTTQLLQVIGPALMANNVLKGKSLFAGRQGERVASDRVAFVDRNDLDWGIHRAPFDAEGAPAQETLLVEEGILRGYLHNQYTARKMGARTTANAGRGGGFRSAPEVGPSNCFLCPGAGSPASLVAQAGSGLFVTQAMGIHTADPVSGDFSLGAAGRRIEHGVLAGPVRGVTIAGNIRDLLESVCAVASDLRFFGAYGAPSVAIGELTVSGR